MSDRNAKKGHGYVPKSVRQGNPQSKSSPTVMIGWVVILVAIGVGIYWIWVGNGKSDETPVVTPSGLKYIDRIIGTGPSPTKGRDVTVHYTGTLENGSKFDSSLDRGQPFTFKIGTGNVIKGWDEGVMTMKVGGKRKLIIPPDLGYGARGAGPQIPPNSILHFEVELLSVK